MNRPNVIALARQLARQQAVIAERDAEIARLQARIAEYELRFFYWAGRSMPTPPTTEDATTRLLQTYSDHMGGDHANE